MPRVNHNLPDAYGLSITVYAPTASEANPIETGEVLKFVDSASNSVAPAGDGDAIQAVAKHRVTDPLEPLGVHVYGFSRIQTFKFSGAAPTLGAGVVADGKGGVKVLAAEPEGAVIPNGTRVLYVDSGLGVVDVAMP